MFALPFKCLDWLLLLLHGEPETQGYNHSNERSHTCLFIYVFIYSSICLTWLENFQVNQLTLLLDLEAAAEQHRQVVAKLTFAAPHPHKKERKKSDNNKKKLAFTIKVCIEMKRWKILIKTTLKWQKGTRAAESYKHALPHRECVVLHKNGALSNSPHIH